LSVLCAPYVLRELRIVRAPIVLCVLCVLYLCAWCLLCGVVRPALVSCGVGVWRVLFVLCSLRAVPAFELPWVFVF
jgi:hypothetical protein